MNIYIKSTKTNTLIAKKITKTNTLDRFYVPTSHIVVNTSSWLVLVCSSFSKENFKKDCQQLTSDLHLNRNIICKCKETKKALVLLFT